MVILWLTTCNIGSHPDLQVAFSFYHCNHFTWPRQLVKLKVKYQFQSLNWWVHYAKDTESYFRKRDMLFVSGILRFCSDIPTVLLIECSSAIPFYLYVPTASNHLVVFPSRSTFWNVGRSWWYYTHKDSMGRVNNWNR